MRTHPTADSEHTEHRLFTRSGPTSCTAGSHERGNPFDLPPTAGLTQYENRLASVSNREITSERQLPPGTWGGSQQQHQSPTRNLLHVGYGGAGGAGGRKPSTVLRRIYLTRTADRWRIPDNTASSITSSASIPNVGDLYLLNRQGEVSGGTLRSMPSSLHLLFRRPYNPNVDKSKVYAQDGEYVYILEVNPTLNHYEGSTYALVTSASPFKPTQDCWFALRVAGQFRDVTRHLFYKYGDAIQSSVAFRESSICGIGNSCLGIVAFPVVNRLGIDCRGQLHRPQPLLTSAP